MLYFPDFFLLMLYFPYFMFLILYLLGNVSMVNHTCFHSSYCIKLDLAGGLVQGFGLSETCATDCWPRRASSNTIAFEISVPAVSEPVVGRTGLFVLVAGVAMGIVADIEKDWKAGILAPTLAVPAASLSLSRSVIKGGKPWKRLQSRCKILLRENWNRLWCNGLLHHQFSSQSRNV